MPKKLLFIALIIIVLFSCNKKPKEKSNIETTKTEVVEQLKVKIINQFPHEKRKYTQGFEVYNGYLYESTGLDNKSSLKKINIKTGEVEKSVELTNFFAEGLTILNDKLTILSYKRGIAIEYDLETFEEKDVEFTYKTEGWGLTNNGSHLIMSDGSNKLFFYNAKTFEKEKVLNVKYEGEPLYFINELEYVDGKIYANIYGSDFIVAIDIESGKVIADIDASNLICSQLSKSDPEAVLNGIAYNKKTKTFYMTGKKCNTIYEVVFE
ncbi:MAG: glutaminyl-peptide cyclotransferase [Bacteroidota bacterium]|nr:glutaminyl-peptide cyclotransferase [Bacteroidota bacterium]